MNISIVSSGLRRKIPHDKSPDANVFSSLGEICALSLTTLRMEKQYRHRTGQEMSILSFTKTLSFYVKVRNHTLVLWCT